MKKLNLLICSLFPLCHIPDLQYADRDARAFVEWLQSPAGGGVPEGNVTLLTNEKATNIAVALTLNDLMADCRPATRAAAPPDAPQPRHLAVPVPDFQRSYFLSVAKSIKRIFLHRN